MLPSVNSIPEWNSSGVLPPINEKEEPSTPYEVRLQDVVTRFGDTDERRRLLTGLLDFRAELHDAGLVRGFQWINGSFVENVEETRGRSPEDIDVVTFFHIPDGHTQLTLFQGFPNLFHHEQVKDTHNIDSYFVPMNQTRPENLVGGRYIGIVVGHTGGAIFFGRAICRLIWQVTEILRHGPNLSGLTARVGSNEHTRASFSTVRASHLKEVD